MTSRDARLDGVRAVAIAGVVVVHTSQTIPLSTPAFLLEAAGLGRFGVQLFFLLSGYLLGSLYSGGGTWSALRYAKRRLARIYPLYFLFALIWLGLAWAGMSSPVSVSAVTIVLTFILANDLWWVSAWGFLPGAWSISAEALHYVVYPVVRRWGARRLGVLAIVFALSSTLVGMYVFFVTGGDYSGEAGQFWTWANTLAPWNTLAFFLVGMALAVGRGWAAPRLGHLARLGLGLGLVAAGVFTVVAGSLTIVVLVATAAIFALLTSARREPGAIVQWIGRRSYGTYFTHFVVLLALSEALEGRSWSAGPVVSVAVLVVAVVVVLGVSSALSQGLWILLERKAIDWSRRGGVPTS